MSTSPSDPKHLTVGPLFFLSKSQRSILLLRHAQAGEDQTRRFVGRTDISLNEPGRAQARALSRWMAIAELSRIVCSDLERAVQTAEILAEPHQLRPEPDHRLREIDLGQWEGLSFEQIKKSDPESFEQRGRDLAGFRPPQGESFADLQSRVVPVFEEISESAGHVAIVGHAGVNRVLICHLLGLELKNMFCLGQDPAGLSILQPRASSGFRLRALNLVPDLA